MSRRIRSVRWCEDTGWEHVCASCGDWWPLTDEFWRKRSMSRCRACWREYQSDYQRTKYAADPEFRETKKAAARITSWKERQLRPEIVRRRKRDYFHANRDRILADMRERYRRGQERVA